MSNTTVNKPGYKHTSFGWIPEEWSVVRLEDVASKERPISYGIVQTGEPIEDGVKCIRVVDIINGTINMENLITTSREISNSYKRTVLRRDDVVMVDVPEKEFGPNR